MKFKQIYFKQLYQKQSWHSDSHLNNSRFPFQLVPYLSVEKKSAIYYPSNQISSTLFSNSLIQINPAAVQLLWNHPLFILCPCHYSHLHKLVSHILWLQSFLGCKSFWSSYPFITLKKQTSVPTECVYLSTPVPRLLSSEQFKNTTECHLAMYLWTPSQFCHLIQFKPLLFSCDIFLAKPEYLPFHQKMYLSHFYLHSTGRS